MNTAFTRQLVSGVNFAKRPASRGELERFPPPCPSPICKRTPGMCCLGRQVEVEAVMPLDLVS